MSNKPITNEIPNRNAVLETMLRGICTRVGQHGIAMQLQYTNQRWCVRVDSVSVIGATDQSLSAVLGTLVASLDSQGLSL